MDHSGPEFLFPCKADYSIVEQLFPDSNTLVFPAAIEVRNLSSAPKDQTIFVVDDESIIAQTVGIILRNAGYETRSFSEPAAALDAAAGESPDLLVTDMAMPEMNGIELANRMQELRPRCKVLVISGHFMTLPQIGNSDEPARDFDFLSKPVHPLKLLEKIEHVLLGAA
ncbi:response regulator [Telmatobacter sp. DSM 110680]|uniref:Response regulator n=1 Tax=Telmatobacter sp. DSM 110680 TaxID=3036704 RepID=A0AAU7DNL4_9BACT